MAALLRRLAGSRCSVRRYLGAILREKHDRAPGLTPRDRGRLAAGDGRPLTAYGGPLSRRLHTEAAAPVEVDLKRLDGEDEGRGTLTYSVLLMVKYVSEFLPTFYYRKFINKIRATEFAPNFKHLKAPVFSFHLFGRS